MPQTDPNSGVNLPDETRFLEYLYYETARTQRFGSCFVVFRLRVDNLDRTDAEAREQILSTVGDLLRQLNIGFRTCDFVARLSNNHFAVVMPHTSHDGGMIKAERVRHLIASHPWHEIVPQFAPITVTIAVVENPGNAVERDSMLTLLDYFLADESVSNQILTRPTEVVTDMSHGTMKLWAQRLGWWTLISILPTFVFTYIIKPLFKRMFSVFIRSEAGEQRSWVFTSQYEEDKDNFDGEFGTDTKSRLFVSGLGGDDDAREHAAAYMPTPRVLVKTMLDNLPIDPREFVFVDAGCGKGIRCTKPV